MMVSLSISGGSRLRPAASARLPPQRARAGGASQPRLHGPRAPRGGGGGATNGAPGPSRKRTRRAGGGASGCSGRETRRPRAAPGRAGLTGEGGLQQGAGPTAAVPGAVTGGGRGLRERAWLAPGCCLRRVPAEGRRYLRGLYFGPSEAPQSPLTLPSPPPGYFSPFNPFFFLPRAEIAVPVLCWKKELTHLVQNSPEYLSFS